MDPGTIIGLVARASSPCSPSLFMEGGNPAAFIIPSPFVLVLLGTLGVTHGVDGPEGVLAHPEL